MKSRLMFTTLTIVGILGALIVPQTSAQPHVAECKVDDLTLCLQDGRFKVVFHRVQEGVARTRGQVSMKDEASGDVWLSKSAQPELSVRISDQCEADAGFAVVIEPKMPVAYEATITDTVTGAQVHYASDGESTRKVTDVPFVACRR